MFQCVGEAVQVLYPRGGKDGPELVDVAGVKTRYGIRPDQVPDFIALRGDPSDGIPGAKGIGEKTAGEILRVHGDLETAIANATQERPKVAQALRNQAEELREFRKIATLQPIPVTCPSDAPTTFGAAATAASTRGMGRLAGRLEELAKKE
jgi:DNA polymerase-1